MRIRRHVVLLILFALLMTSTSIATARGILNGDACQVEPDETIEGDLFVLCGELDIEGSVEGSVIGAARTVDVSGEVGGSLYMLAGELHISGAISKDVHFLGLILNVSPAATFGHETSSIISANLSNTIETGATVPGNVTNLGYQLIAEGDVDGEINFWGSALSISGTVRQDVTATVGNSETDGASSQIETLLLPFQFEVELIDPGLVIAESGVINGQLDYTGARPGVIDGELASPPVHHSTSETLLATGQTVEETAARTLGRYLRVVGQEFMALAFVGVLSVVFIPRYLQSPVRSLQDHPLSTLGVGMVSFILSFPIVLIVALLSILLIILLSLLSLDNVVLFSAIVLGLANIGGASIFYFTAIYIARVVVALAIGRLVMRFLMPPQFYRQADWRTVLLTMGAGVLVLSMLGSIPLVGWGFNALALFLGLGAILTVLQQQFRRFRSSSEETPARPPMRYAPHTTQQIPHVTGQEDRRHSKRRHSPYNADATAIGTQELPEGFNWWRSEND